MTRLPKILAAGAAVAALSFTATAWCQTTTNVATLKAGLSGMWEVAPHRPGRGGPPGGRPGGPPPGGVRFGPGNGPPPGGPDDDASDLPGPNVEGLDRGDKMTYAMMTPAGKAVFEAMDPHDLPANNCKSNGLPSLVGIPDVQEWTFAGDLLTVHYANFNTVRTIYLDGRAASGAPSLYGHSAGRFENGELVVTTTNLIATPGGLGRNAPGSASRTYVEHYRLAGDGSGVTGYVTIHDPEYLTRDLTVPIGFQRAAAGTEIPDVECSVEASQRYLKD